MEGSFMFFKKVTAKSREYFPEPKILDLTLFWLWNFKNSQFLVSGEGVD